MPDEETTTAQTDDDVTVQPTLPTLELPEYHGRRPVAMKTSVSGAGNRISRSHEIGERVVLVLETRVRRAGHEEIDDDGLVYAETLKVVDLFEVQGPAGKRLLSTVRQAHRTSDDARLGRASLPLGAEWTEPGYADGAALTPTGLAEFRGDPAAALGDERLSPVVVVYSDKARELWPDDFEPGVARPNVGDRFEVEGEGSGPVDYVYVEELLHADTGETVAKWTRGQLLPGETGFGDGLEPLEKEVEFREDEDGFAEPVSLEPTPEDYGFVDRQVDGLLEALEQVVDLDKARRILEAEKRGRGRNLKTRKGAVDLILRRIAALEQAAEA